MVKRECTTVVVNVEGRNVTLYNKFFKVPCQLYSLLSLVVRRTHLTPNFLLHHCGSWFVMLNIAMDNYKIIKRAEH